MMLTLPMLLGLASCNDNDDNSTNPLGSQVTGMWYNVTDGEGTLPTGWGNGQDTTYTRVVNALQLNDDGTGYICTMWFNDEKRSPLDIAGGLDERSVDPLSYTTTQDGCIILRFGEEDSDDFFKSWTLSYADGAISCNDGSETFQMQLAESAMEGWLLDIYQAFMGGGEAENYNINENTVKYAGAVFKPITSSNWREQGSIFLYVGGTGNPDIVDTRKGHGYELVNLPWSNAPQENHLPDDFCDDITPANGWEMVLNFCGNRSVANGNFIGLYNKYTGTLRFFYYMPDIIYTGNDHAWEVALTDNLAQHSLWAYGLPSAGTIKDKSPFLAGRKTLIDHVTPWTEIDNAKGEIQPKTGWWAFDVDLSLYRPNTDITNDKITLRMNSWNTEHVSLYSTMTANIEGELKQKIAEGSSSSSTSKGLLTSLQMATGIIGAIAGFYAGSETGIVGGFGLLGNALGAGASMCGGNQPFEASISLGLNGNIDTNGFIAGSASTVGVAEPTIALSDFKLSSSSAFGHGVWNLKDFPAVYYLNDASYRVQSGNQRAYYLCFPYIFDSGSIEVELNPDVFPESEVEWMRVDATCVSTAQLGMTGTDPYRNAFGLQSLTQPFHEDTRVHVIDVQNDPKNKLLYPFLLDFLYYSEEKGSMLYPVPLVADGGFLVIGRGYQEGYLIEPGLLHATDGTTEVPFDIQLPSLVVNVILQVKVKSLSEPLVYFRNYLPELKGISWKELPDIRDQIQAHQLNPKQADHCATYNYQKKRAGNVLNELINVFQ